MPPSIASSSSTLINGPVTLPLAKLSYCTTATLSSHMQWIHLTNQSDLFAVFDTIRRLDVSEQISEKHILKLVNGRDLVIRKIQLNFRPGNGYDRALEFLQSFLLPIKDTVAPVSLVPVRPQSSQAAYPSLAQPYKQPSTHTSRSTNSYIPTWQSQSSQYAYSSTSQQPMLQVSNFDEFPPDWVPSSAQPARAVIRQPSVPEKSDQSIIKGAIASMPHHRLSKGTDWESETFAPAILGSREWRPVSAPETQCARETSDSCGLSQMLPPQRKLPFPETREEPPSRNNDSLATVSQGLASEPKVVQNIPAKRKKAPSATRTQSAQAKASERNLVE
ncbi:MAG: hypothetical protein Q9164_003893 [Protoblastenia rupestris]